METSMPICTMSSASMRKARLNMSLQKLFLRLGISRTMSLSSIFSRPLLVYFAGRRFVRLQIVKELRASGTRPYVNTNVGAAFGSLKIPVYMRTSDSHPCNLSSKAQSQSRRRVG